MNKKLLILILLCFSSVAALAQTQTQESERLKTPLVILERAQADYTAEARKKGVEGAVKLRVTFKSDGKIGDITDVTIKNKEKLVKFGLTENAFTAARKIKFKPAVENGKSVSVTRTVEYLFSLY